MIAATQMRAAIAWSEWRADQVQRPLRVTAVFELGEIQVPADVLLAEVAEREEVSVAQLRGRSRAVELVLARHEVWWRLSTQFGLTDSAIGRQTGGFTHAAVAHGIRKHQARLAGGGGA